MKETYRPLDTLQRATRRLSGKYGTDLERRHELDMTAADAVQAVANALHGHLGSDHHLRRMPAADLDDCLAGLSLTDEAKTSLDRREFDVICGARALGATWQQIGIALGHTPQTAERAAAARYGALRRRFPLSRPFASPTELAASLPSPRQPDPQAADE